MRARKRRNNQRPNGICYQDEKPPEVVIHHEEKVDFIPSDIGLSDMEVSLVNVMAHEKIMEQALEPFKDKYDYCLIDCMPSLGIITVACLLRRIEC